MSSSSVPGSPVLSAAVALTARGARVTVLEARPRLGGRATSYRDRSTGELVDNGQHILFGCYRETLRFLRTIGAAGDVRFQESLGVSYLDRDNRRIRFQCPHLPPPLHLIAGVLEWEAVAARERLAGLRMIGPLRRARRHEAVTHPDETVREWLVRHGQGPRLRELLWEPLALAALNQRPDQAAAAPFARVLCELCGTDPADAAVGIPTRPLEQFYAEPARTFIESRGGEVRTKAPREGGGRGSSCGRGRDGRRAVDGPGRDLGRSVVCVSPRLRRRTATARARVGCGRNNGRGANRYRQRVVRAAGARRAVRRPRWSHDAVGVRQAFCLR